MQIVIPMSGFGERFRRVGYEVPKPLIEIDGKTIISHVVDMFPGENNFIFIVNQEHLDNSNYAMEAELRRIAPQGKIVPIPPHKLGPINAVAQAMSEIDMSLPTIVNYCDFTCLWNWEAFKDFVSVNNLAGCLPAYKGFHPHSLGTTNYAYIREEHGKFLDIQEKNPFTQDRMNEYASSGTYYFSSGALMKEAFDYVVENNLDVNGEFYVSMAYKYLASNGASTYVYPLQHFMQWGTPEDVREYEGWSKAFTELTKLPPGSDNEYDALIMPMAGLGSRFADAGYLETKPLIKVSGSSMVLQATKSLPKAKQNTFVLRTDMSNYVGVENEITNSLTKVSFVELNSINDGQARTVAEGLKTIETAGPVIVGACDNGLLFDENKHELLLEAGDVDLIVWVARGHANAARRPEMFGWAKTSGDRVTGVSVKVPLEDPNRDPIVIGTMTFRSKKVLEDSLTCLFARDGKINGEYYLDSVIDDAIELGYKVVAFEVDSYISWGTPNDLRTFEYWQSCFHLWDKHPYSLSKDRWVAASAVGELAKEIKLRTPVLKEGKLLEL